MDTANVESVQGLKPFADLRHVEGIPKKLTVPVITNANFWETIDREWRKGQTPEQLRAFDEWKNKFPKLTLRQRIERELERDCLVLLHHGTMVYTLEYYLGYEDPLKLDWVVKGGEGISGVDLWADVYNGRDDLIRREEWFCCWPNCESVYGHYLRALQP